MQDFFPGFRWPQLATQAVRVTFAARPAGAVNWPWRLYIDRDRRGGTARLVLEPATGPTEDGDHDVIMSFLATPEQTATLPAGQVFVELVSLDADGPRRWERWTARAVNTLGPGEA